LYRVLKFVYCPFNF